jgi:heavy metal translocating P-type ATPase
MTLSTPNSRPALQTKILIRALHCPTCVSFLEDYLSNYDKHVSKVSASIMTQEVLLEHQDILNVPKLADDLSREGYKVDAWKTMATKASNKDEISPLLSLPLESLEPDVPKSVAQYDSAHHARCELCSHMTEERPQGDASGLEEKAMPLEVRVDLPETRIRLAQLSIEGMTCSSCVGTLTRGFEEHAWVVGIDVALLSNSANVRYFEGHKADELVRICEDLGYKATVENDEEEPSRHGPEKIEKTPASWEATFTISGLTCASCVSTLHDAIDQLPYVRTSQISFLHGTAKVVLTEKKNVSSLKATIDSTGYSATLVQVKALGLTHDITERKITVKVLGMHCDQCPKRIKETLLALDKDMRITEELVHGEPIFAIAYKPRAPVVTVRSIMAAIDATDKTFQVSLFKRMTIEERARVLQARNRHRLLLRVILATSMAVPTFIIGIVLMTLVSSDNKGRIYFSHTLQGVARGEWALLAFSSPVYFFAADVFHRGMIKGIYALWRKGSTTPFLQRFYKFGSMDTLLSLGTSIAYFSSVAQLIVAASHKTDMEANGMSYFDSVVFLTMFLLFGRLLEAYTKERTGEAIQKLGSLRPSHAILVEEDSKAAKDVSIDLLETGDLVRVLHGATPPWDGQIIEGDSAFSEASLTGESKPVRKMMGDAVYSGTINLGDTVTIRLTASSGRSMLDKIIDVVREGQMHRAPIERIVDKLTRSFVPAVTLIAILTWLVWLGLGVSGRLPAAYLDVTTGGWPFWSLQFAIAVFVVACPCGIGLAAPTALFVGGGLAAENGILAKGGGEAFQEASKVNIVVFDKTGTLTKGQGMDVTRYEFFTVSWAQDNIYQCMLMLEEQSSHPIASALVTFIHKHKQSARNQVKLVEIQEFPGKGMAGIFYLDDSNATKVRVIVGNETLLREKGVAMKGQISEITDAWRNAGSTAILVAGEIDSQKNDEGQIGNWQVLAAFALDDEMREEAKSVLECLRHRGIEHWMLTGDSEKTAMAIGASIGIPAARIVSGVLPEEKSEKIKQLQMRPGAVVAMIGDGINDSPALSQADVGIAIGSGSDIAISSAKFVLLQSDLQKLICLLDLSKRVIRRVKFNFFWAFLYNMIALPVAAGVLYPVVSNGRHVRLDPVWASLAMALSSVSVICSSLLLRCTLRLPQKISGRLFSINKIWGA